jgi:tRNA G18 (ribose-2'-O)-methylase SpoU
MTKEARRSNDEETRAVVRSSFVQERHKPAWPLERPRELIVACPPMRSNVNLSRIARAAGCCGVRRMVCCGNARPIGKIARDASETLQIEVHRTLPPVLDKLRGEGYTIVGLEQTSGAASLFEFAFRRRTVLVVGNERTGVEEEVLLRLDQAVEIPVYGLPYAHNAATAAAMALYEYCRQYPQG